MKTKSDDHGCFTARISIKPNAKPSNGEGAIDFAPNQNCD